MKPDGNLTLTGYLFKIKQLEEELARKNKIISELREREAKNNKILKLEAKVETLKEMYSELLNQVKHTSENDE